MRKDDDPGELAERLFASRTLDRVYTALVNEEDTRVCTDIDDRACRVVPGNFVLQVLTQFFTKLGDAIANPKTVLAWLLSALSAPGVFTAFLVPIRESGSMLPQLLIAARIRARAIRKWTFVTGCVLQAVAVFAMALVALTLAGTLAGFALLGALLVFSLARGLCSVASKDVLGKTVPKSRRGRVSGWSATLAGAVTIAVGILLLFDTAAPDSVTSYLLLLATAGLMWLVAGSIYVLIREFPGETEGGGNAIAAAMQRLSLLHSDAPFRNFVVARSLLLCSALSAPFFIMMAHENTAGALLVLGMFVIADGLASVVSAPFWGHFADVSSRRVMIVAGVWAALTGVALSGLTVWSASLATTTWIYPTFYFLLAIAHAGVRLGRKTYVIDLASGNRRTDYVAVSNTVIGAVLLLAGSVGALTTVMPTAGVIVLLAGMGLAGAVLSARLPEVT